jgi:hypothetical protein
VLPVDLGLVLVASAAIDRLDVLEVRVVRLQVRSSMEIDS